MNEPGSHINMHEEYKVDFDITSLSSKEATNSENYLNYD